MPRRRKDPCAVAGRDGLRWGTVLLRKKSSLHDLHLAWIGAIAKDPCCYCGKAGGSIDHIVPRSVLKGAHWENKTGACRKCNSAKSDTPLLRYLARRHGRGIVAVKLLPESHDVKKAA